MKSQNREKLSDTRGHLQVPITMGSSLPLIGTSEGAETSAKRVLRTIVQLERVGLGAVFARTLHIRLRKTVNITHQEVQILDGGLKVPQATAYSSIAQVPSQ